MNRDRPRGMPSSHIAPPEVRHCLDSLDSTDDAGLIAQAQASYDALHKDAMVSESGGDR